MVAELLQFQKNYIALQLGENLLKIVLQRKWGPKGTNILWGHMYPQLTNNQVRILKFEYFDLWTCDIINMHNMNTKNNWLLPPTMGHLYTKYDKCWVIVYQSQASQTHIHAWWQTRLLFFFVVEAPIYASHGCIYAYIHIYFIELVLEHSILPHKRGSHHCFLENYQHKLTLVCHMSFVVIWCQSW